MFYPLSAFHSGLTSLSACPSGRTALAAGPARAAAQNRPGDEWTQAREGQPPRRQALPAQGFRHRFATGPSLVAALLADRHLDILSHLVAAGADCRTQTYDELLGADARLLDPFDRAALESLQAEAVVPIRRGEALAAFLCLGPKGSGDIYTPTDLSLLAAVAETLSLQLNRFDQEETIREGHVMQEALRRYVPGAIADQLSSGGDLDAADREVTGLCVDIRGYTSFSERRRPADIFSTVNRYTRTVSEIVHRHGGAVVEFNGDGMMVVFGAPRDLARKEVAAVHAAREISARVSEIVVEGDSGDSTTLSVGIGIATGAAFVGNIQAVDRMIWSAIGNTTNLAARLQSLTRDLGADVVVDAATWKNLGSDGSDFQKHEEIPIRGRRDVRDVYALHAPGDPSIPYVPAGDPSVDPPTA